MHRASIALRLLTLAGCLFGLHFHAQMLHAQPLPDPIVPPDEQPFLSTARERLPGLGWIDFGDSGITFDTATTESVGDGTGLLVFSEIKRPGRIVAYNSKLEVSETRNDFIDWAGISFWYRGDGTDATGVLAWGNEMNYKTRFPLGNTGWKKHFVPWDTFGEYFDRTKSHSNLVLSIELPDEVNYNYTLEHVRMFKGERPTNEYRRASIESKWPPRLVRSGGGFVIESKDLDYENTDGVHFWVFPGGTFSKGTLAWWGRTDDKKFFSLENRRWQHRSFTWDELPPRPTHIPLERQRLIFSLQPPRLEGHWFVMDRLHLYKHPVIETVSPTPRKDALGHLSTKDFLKRREKMNAFSQRLRRTEPMTVVAIGDSIISGANLAYLHNGEERFYMSGFGGWMLSATASRFGYSSSFLNVELFDPRSSRWNQITPASPFRKGFYATVLGTQGTNSELGPSGLERVESYRPDLVLVQPGVYDVFYGTPEGFEQKLDNFIQALHKKNYQVVLGSQTPVADMEPNELIKGENYYERSKAYAAICEKVADRYDLPFVDVRGALEARGPRGLGDNFQDTIHPNKRGHRIIGILYYAMLSGEDNTIWQYVPKPKELGNPYLPKQE